MWMQNVWNAATLDIHFKLQEKEGQTPIFAESSLPIYI